MKRAFVNVTALAAAAVLYFSPNQARATYGCTGENLGPQMAAAANDFNAPEGGCAEACGGLHYCYEEECGELNEELVNGDCDYGGRYDSNVLAARDEMTFLFETTHNCEWDYYDDFWEEHGCDCGYQPGEDRGTCDDEPEGECEFGSEATCGYNGGNPLRSGGG